MVKVVLLRFQQYFGQFTVVLVQGSSETVLFRHYLTMSFGVRKFKIYQLSGSFSLLKIFKIESKFRK